MPVKVNVFYVNKLLRDPKGPVGKDLRRSGTRIRNSAKRYCPVDTGRLRSSIQMSPPRMLEFNTLVVRVGTKVKYARFVELGTRYMRPRSFLRKALNEEVR